MILCLDYGSRYIGLAITDPDGHFTLRYSTIDQKQQDAFLAIASMIQKECIKKVVVGLPLNLKGQHTQQTRETQAFIDKLQQTLGDRLTIEPIDETLTSVEASKRITIEGLPQSEEHAEAARLMLEDYLRQK